MNIPRIPQLLAACSLVLLAVPAQPVFAQQPKESHAGWIEVLVPSVQGEGCLEVRPLPFGLDAGARRDSLTIDLAHHLDWSSRGAETREDGALQRALAQFVVQGIHTTIPLHQKIFEDEEFRSGHFDTKFMERFFERQKEAQS